MVFFRGAVKKIIHLLQGTVENWSPPEGSRPKQNPIQPFWFRSDRTFMGARLILTLDLIDKFNAIDICNILWLACTYPSSLVLLVVLCFALFDLLVISNRCIVHSGNIYLQKTGFIRQRTRKMRRSSKINGLVENIWWNYRIRRKQNMTARSMRSLCPSHCVGNMSWRCRFWD